MVRNGMGGVRPSVVGDVQGEGGTGVVSGCKGGVGMLLAVGCASGGRVLAGVVIVCACPQAVRQKGARHASGECGQSEGAWCKGPTWGGSGGQGPAPGHGVPLVCLLGDQVGMVVAISMP